MYPESKNLDNKIFRNKKNGRLYSTLYTAVDTTNSRAGVEVVVYIDHDPNSKNLYACAVIHHFYVRELTEFYEKFDEIDLKQ